MKQRTKILQFMNSIEPDAPEVAEDLTGLYCNLTIETRKNIHNVCFDRTCDVAMGVEGVKKGLGEEEERGRGGGGEQEVVKENHIPFASIITQCKFGKI